MTETIGVPGSANGANGANGANPAAAGSSGKVRKAKAAAATGATGGQGLTLQRLYTTAGVHPYDEVTWQRRDVVMTNWRDGTVNFEQRGVEFPDFWSVNATNIVTSKYFRGAVGTPTRECEPAADHRPGGGDVHQRPASSTATSPPSEDAEIFEHELTWMLLHQVFAFNSPVWFNVGTKSPQQVSPCQPYDALVSTPAGLVPIGELVRATTRWVPRSTTRTASPRCVATKANGVKEVLRIHTKAGYTLDVTADHLVWRSTGEGTGRFVAAGELRVGDQLEWHRRDVVRRGGDHAPATIAEAALAGWLQSDGFVGQYDGTNRSLTIEAMTVTDAELAWVTDLLDAVFPGEHRHEPRCETHRRRPGLPSYPADTERSLRRLRVDRWALRASGVEHGGARSACSTAPLPVVAAYLRSVFQAEGLRVGRGSGRRWSAVDMISERLVRGVQALLQPFRDLRPGRAKGRTRGQNRHDLLDRAHPERRRPADLRRRDRLHRPRQGGQSSKPRSTWPAVAPER